MTFYFSFLSYTFVVSAHVVVAVLDDGALISPDRVCKGPANVSSGILENDFDFE